MIAAITCSPAPTTRASNPSRISPIGSVSATLTVSGTRQRRETGEQNDACGVMPAAAWYAMTCTYFTIRDQATGQSSNSPYGDPYLCEFSRCERVPSLREKGCSVQEAEDVQDEGYAAERDIRDAYASRLREFRPAERLWKTEHTYRPSLLRGDLRTVDELNRVRIWEFKIKARFDALGQVLTYVALARHELHFSRPVLGVLAAFEVPTKLRQTIEILNLGIEVVILPEQLRLAGRVPLTAHRTTIPHIPLVPPISPRVERSAHE